MTHPPDIKFLIAIPAAVMGIAAMLALIWVVGQVVRYLLADRALRPVLRKAWRIKRTWKRTARRVGLVQAERSRPPLWSNTPATTVITRELVPTIKVGVERWGVRVDSATIGQLGVKQFQDAADHLADTWRVSHVRVEQARPGLIRLRAVVTDPLTHSTQWTQNTTGPGDPAVWLAGVDADGRPVTLRSAGVSGVVVAGLAGYGKTSFLNARFCQLAPSPAVQFVLIDGKGGPDYDDLFTRAWLHAKDDPQLVRDHLAKVRDLMVGRQHAIRDLLNVKNMWHVGPSQSWPLVVVVIDEAHTFLNETKGTDVESKRLDALARETARLTDTCATLLLERGVELVTIKEMLGHAQITITAKTYAHVRIRLQRQAIESMGDALDGGDDGKDDDDPGQRATVRR
jgi:S-DNA-T family DNA segregation ATPase FtsK/SpoIIIE